MSIGKIEFKKPVLIWTCIIFIVEMALALLIAHVHFREQYVSIFGSFWTSGHAITQGQNPYIVPPKELVSRKYHNDEINLNPPFLLPLFQVFALLAPWKAATAWMITLWGLIFMLPVLILAAGYILRLYQPVFTRQHTVNAE
jgi:hypothetical protein